MRLISMTDAIIQAHQGVFDIDVLNYAKFLKTPLELGMFVPCDEDGNILEYIEWLENEELTKERILYENEYNKAKERVIFEDCSIFSSEYIHFDKGRIFRIDQLKTITVEYFCGKGLIVTQNAIKKYGI